MGKKGCEQLISRLWAIAVTGILGMGLLISPSASFAAEDIYGPVKKRLMAEGITQKQVTLLFQPPPAPLFKVVAATFRIREGKLSYDQFLTPASIAKAQRFFRENEPILSKAEAKYNVDPCVIVAILLVETQFGSYTGKTPTLGILATFALMDQPVYQNKIWSMLSPAERQRWGREGFDNKLKSRCEWASKELLALARLVEAHGTRVATLQGSVMGAVGWPQFLPSSLSRYGADGNADGRIDLFHSEDAIFSVANYLKGYGWCEAKTREAKESVIYQYNHSRPYVSTILGVADRIR